MEKLKKVRRDYRINSWVYEEMKKLLEEMRITETSFVEMAIIEKMARIQQNNEDRPITQ